MQTPAQPARTGNSAPSLLRTLAGEALDPPPVWLMRQAGRYLPEYRRLRRRAGSFLQLCLTPELAAEVTLQPVRRFRLDAAILFADILLVPHALGQALDYVDGEGPRLDALATPGDLRRLLPPEAVDEALSPVYETVARVRRNLPPQTALIGFAGAPWTVATYMIGGGRGQEAALGWVERHPEGYAALSRRIEAATVRYLCRQAEAGADALQLFDSWAGSLPQDAFRRHSIEAAARVVDGVRARFPDVPIVGFPRGAGPEGYLAFARGAGVSALALDQSIPAEWAAKTLQPLMPVQGNLDPGLLAPGTAGLEEEAARIRRAFQRGPHVFNLGHGIRPDADPDRVARLVAAVRNPN